MVASSRELTLSCSGKKWEGARAALRPERRLLFLAAQVPQLPIAMLACARIGAVHSVVFGGFSAEALAGRLIDAQARPPLAVPPPRAPLLLAPC